MADVEKNPFFGKKILISHFRVGKTDGVSIEIDAWKEILTQAGAIVKLCSGPVNLGADFVISNLEQQLNPEIFQLDEAAFKPGLLSEDQIRSAIEENQQTMANELDQILSQFQPDLLIISNIFSVGEHISAAGAFTKVLDKRQIPTLAVHHDFWWESIRHKEPSCNFVRDQLSAFFPPVRSYLKHATINSLAQASLKARKNLDSAIVYDTIDFTKPIEKRSLLPQLLDICSPDFDDILLLQATRIVRRKNIEIAIDICHRLSQPDFLIRLSQKALYNGKHFDPKTNQIKLVMAGYAEKRDEKYRDLLYKYAEELGVSICNVGDLINTPSSGYTLWDAYPKADLVTYPPEYEGFGNQLLETVYAKKPIALFEYPVFKSDIASKGFSYISLGDQIIEDDRGLKHLPDKVLDNACQEIVDILTNSNKYQAITENNFSIGQKNFSYANTLNTLSRIISASPSAI